VRQVRELAVLTGAAVVTVTIVIASAWASTVLWKGWADFAPGSIPQAKPKLWTYYVFDSTVAPAWVFLLAELALFGLVWLLLRRLVAELER
jgi:hypothetical protein